MRVNDVYTFKARLTRLRFMDTKELLKEALQLRPAERLQLIELLTKSLDKPDPKIEHIWGEEAEKRYEALKAGKVKTIPLDEIIQKYTHTYLFHSKI